MHTGDTVPCACGSRRQITSNPLTGATLEYCLAGARCTVQPFGTPRDAHDPTLAERQAGARAIVREAVTLDGRPLMGRHLTDVRARAGLSMRRLAEAAGLTMSTVRALEAVPDDATVDALHGNQQRSMARVRAALEVDAEVEAPNRAPMLQQLREREREAERTNRRRKPSALDALEEVSC